MADTRWSGNGMVAQILRILGEHKLISIIRGVEEKDAIKQLKPCIKVVFARWR